MTKSGSSRWNDPGLPPSERVDALIAEMSLEEKLGQLVGLWVGADASGGDVAPHQGDMTEHGPSFAEVIEHGLGQLTRPFGTAPVDPVLGAQSLAKAQREIMAANRFGIPAQVHEECLAGFAAWTATAYPVPLSWGATFHPELIEEMGAQIAEAMRSVGVHQGLAPVLDVVRDYRWGRVEETVGEDPYLVGMMTARYVRGMESVGVVATLKHFAGYSGSRAGRNHAPVSAGPREMADIFYPPFEMALRLGGARSVMNSYAEVDGVPAAADESRLTGLLRDEWGFGGVVVADYFAIAFLRTLQGVAGSDGEAAALALHAGIDVELPSVFAYGEPLAHEVRQGRVGLDLVDRALRRVLHQKIELGLLDPDYRPEVVAPDSFDTAERRDVALRLAREAIVLLSNREETLPLPTGSAVAVIGPLADDPYAMLGCYSFPAHVGVHHPQVPMGIEIPSVLASLRSVHDGEIGYARGCDVSAPGRDGFAEAVALAAASDVALVVVGDRAGLFGRGTSGEGCDAEDLRLPGEQQALVEAVLATGTPVVLIAISGRPYALGFATGAAAMVQTFFPGQLGGQALAEVLTGEVSPSGRLPVSLPRDPSDGPGTYLAPPLAGPTDVSNLDPRPLFPFGHGRGYTTTEWGAVTCESTEWASDGEVELSLEVVNTSARHLGDVVQVYLHDPVAQVTRPTMRLIAFQRVDLPPGERAEISFTLHADLTSFAGLDGARVVETGQVELRIARSVEDVHAVVPLVITGVNRRVGIDRHLAAISGVRTGPGQLKEVTIA